VIQLDNVGLLKFLTSLRKNNDASPVGVFPEEYTEKMQQTHAKKCRIEKEKYAITGLVDFPRQNIREKIS